MKKDPKISVIMSVYNGLPLGPQPKTKTASSAYLKEAVESILNQTYRNFEFIIVDDASRDKSWDYLKSLKDRRIKLIRNKKNLGLAASLNIALRQAQGDYVARMDADDISLPNRFEEQIYFLQKNPTIDLCGTWVDLIDEKGKIIGEKKFPTDPKKLKRSITWYTPIVHPTYMAKSRVYKNLNGYRTTFDFAEDYDFLSRAKNKFHMSNIPRKLLLWRFQDNRRSRSSMQKMDKIDLKIKLDSLKRDGLTITGILAAAKKFTMVYFLPFTLKLRIARLLKIA
ncbi:hypothetical protein A2164_03745 [Candidatus Curtissbacteria bacterium RBG_13_35_7]|uniref:Glycosyltransferase 2-like domain-containing protein n=1 Tax=Candidatus Curtissbacteria bacterium RBG_13_35_7 TaxID=1797705 RepID=A0A1F5G2Z6_9BACT|nr:MAG: hypothetical protein A2164_03745 [Candidatus Curtissbacteria bacterium RBG_13_35_7]